jgi:uncharacterized protein YoxC
MKTEQEIPEAEYLKQDSTLLTNFTKDDFEVYQKAVGHYNWIKGVPVIEIREKAYNIARFLMDDCMSLHKTGHYDGEGLDNFWRLHELYRNELHLKSQLSSLQEENERINKEANHWMNQCLEKCAKLDNTISEVKTLREALHYMIGYSQMLTEMFLWAKVKDGRAVFQTSEEMWNTYKKYHTEAIQALSALQSKGE